MEIRATKIANYFGLSKPAITNATKKGKLRKNEKGLYDLNNDTNQKWLISKGFDFNNVNDLITGSKKFEKIKEKPKQDLEIIIEKESILEKTNINSENIENKDFETLSGIPEKYANMTIKELVLLHGGPLGLKIYVEILDKIFSANKKDVEIQERRRVLIEKDFVVNHLFTYIDVFMSKIFDYPESVIEKEIAEIKTDEDKARIEIPKMHRDNFSKIAKEIRKKIKEQLKNLEKKYEVKNDR